MKKRIIKMWLKGMYVSDRKEIAKFIADGMAAMHRKDMIEKLLLTLDERTHLQRYPRSKNACR
jgi:hypothetical protein